jgi:hypothetical protein
MRSRSLPIIFLALASAALVATGCDQGPGQTAVPVIRVSAPADATPEGRSAKVFEGWIKDVRPAISLLILTVGKGIEAQDRRFDMGEARIVGPSGAEWKGQDLRLGDRVRVTMTDDGTLVQQISVLPRSPSGGNE